MMGGKKHWGSAPFRCRYTYDETVKGDDVCITECWAELDYRSLYSHLDSGPRMV